MQQQQTRQQIATHSAKPGLCDFPPALPLPSPTVLQNQRRHSKAPRRLELATSPLEPSARHLASTKASTQAGLTLGTRRAWVVQRLRPRVWRTNNIVVRQQHSIRLSDGHGHATAAQQVARARHAPCLEVMQAIDSARISLVCVRGASQIRAAAGQAHQGQRRTATPPPGLPRSPIPVASRPEGA